MTEQPPTSAPVGASKPGANSQAVVAFTIVLGLVLIGIGAIISAIVDHGLAALAYGAVGVVVGSLATALNAPTGIANVIAEARKSPPDSGTPK